MKRMLKFAALFLSCIVALSACAKSANKAPGGRQGGAMPAMGGQNRQGDITAVETTLAEVSDISSEYMYSGTVQPKTQVDVTASIGGKVKTVNFDVGDDVKKGDVLFAMDTEDIQNSINVSEANLKSAEANVKSAQTNLELANGANMKNQIENAANSVKNAQTSITNAENSVKDAQTSLDSSRIALEKAKNDYETGQTLFNAGGLSQESLDDYKDAYDKAQNSYNQSEINLEKAQTSYKSALDSLEQAQTQYDITANQTPAENERKAQDSLAQAQASKAASEAQLENSKKSLKDAVVTSPISGTVLECNVTEGAEVSGTPFIIIDLNTVNVEVNVSEQIINSIKEGDSVKLKITTLSDEIFNGSITSIAPGANNDGTYNVKIEINNSDRKLKSGMFAEVYFTKEKSDSSIVLPRSAVMSKDDEYYVFTVENGTAKRAVVNVGIDNGDEIEIKSGINIGDTVVVKGQSYLKDGDPVNDVTNRISEQQEQQNGADNIQKKTGAEINSQRSK